MQDGINSFVWDEIKELENIIKHGIDFSRAVKVFNDPKRKVIIDSKHSGVEQRFFCIGEVDGRLVTVRFTYREDNIRIIGAGYWRKGGRYYDQKKQE